MLNAITDFHPMGGVHDKILRASKSYGEFYNKVYWHAKYAASMARRAKGN
jgi:hypothetical protein